MSYELEALIEQAELFDLPWLRVACAAGCDREHPYLPGHWFIARAQDGSLVKLGNNSASPVWVCPCGACNSVSETGETGQLPPLPGMGDEAVHAITQLLCGRKGRPPSPSRLPEIEKAVANLRAAGKKVTQEEVATELRVASSKSVRRYLKSAGRSWAEVIGGSS